MLQLLSESPIAVGAGVLGTICLTAWPLLRSRTAILTAQAAEAAFFAMHYALLGAHAATAVNGLGAFQAATATSVEGSSCFRWLNYLTTGLVGMAIALTWHGTPSLFAAIAAALITLGRLQTNTLRLRFLMLAAQPFWIVHDLAVGSVPGLVADLATMATGACMLAREMDVRDAMRRLGWNFATRDRTIGAMVTTLGRERLARA